MDLAATQDSRRLQAIHVWAMIGLLFLAAQLYVYSAWIGSSDFHPTALGTDPQYQKLCRIQKSFRARLTPKPKRVNCPASPGSHPRTDPKMQAAFAQWLASYERLCQNRPVCAYLADYGNGRPSEAARAVAELHDRMTLQGEGPLV